MTGDAENHNVAANTDADLSVGGNHVAAPGSDADVTETNAEADPRVGGIHDAATEGEAAAAVLSATPEAAVDEATTGDGDSAPGNATAAAAINPRSKRPAVCRAAVDVGNCNASARKELPRAFDISKQTTNRAPAPLPKHPNRPTR